MWRNMVGFERRGVTWAIAPQDSQKPVRLAAMVEARRWRSDTRCSIGRRARCLTYNYDGLVRDPSSAPTAPCCAQAQLANPTHRLRFTGRCLRARG